MGAGSGPRLVPPDPRRNFPNPTKVDLYKMLEEKMRQSGAESRAS